MRRTSPRHHAALDDAGTTQQIVSQPKVGARAYGSNAEQQGASSSPASFHTVVKDCRLARVPTLTNLNGLRQRGATSGISLPLAEAEKGAAQSGQKASDGAEPKLLPQHSNGTVTVKIRSNDDNMDSQLARDISSSETEDSEDGDSPAIRCTVCCRGNRSAEMVLCDHCDAGVHLSCHDPPMSIVPSHDFFCSRCCAAVGYPDSLNGCLPSLAQVSLALDELVNTVVTSCWRQALAVGDRCDALDRTGTWYSGRVVQVREGHEDCGRQCLIHFDGWSTRLDEWIPIDSDCLQMLGSQDRDAKHSHTKRRRSGKSQVCRRPPLKRQRDNAAESVKVVPKLVEVENEQGKTPANIRLMGLTESIVQRRNPLQPFCLFENVANMPRGELDRATEQLKMPFTMINSGDISAASRLRCYWSNSGFPPEFLTHNLPESHPLTVGEFIGKKTLATLKWPEWDRPRLQSKFRVIHTKAGTDKMNAINRLIDMHGIKSLEADAETQDLILRNNLIWTAHGNLRCMTTAERERLLGFPVGYTSGFTMSVQSSMLGESFHVDTIAHLLRPVVAQMPQVPVILSLCDGIGAAKLALKRCGDCQRLMRMHWDDAQDGILIQLADVRDLAAQDDVLGALQQVVGLGDISIDLCIGGWPCNNLSGYNRAAGRNGRCGLDGSKSSLLFPLSEIVTQLCSQPFFGTCARDTATVLPPMTTVTVVQKRQQYRATVIESIRRRQPTLSVRPALSDVSTTDAGSAILWYRVRFAESVVASDDSNDMWLPACAIFTSSVSTSDPAVSDEDKQVNAGTDSAMEVSDTSDTPRPVCAECSQTKEENLNRCEGCFKHWHISCMVATHRAAANIWEEPADALLDERSPLESWFCYECLHPIPSSRKRDDSSGGRGVTRSLGDPDDIACMRCRRLDDAEQMILCDACDAGFHIFCLDPPLKSIPDGDWLCPNCLPNHASLRGPFATAHVDGIAHLRSSTGSTKHQGIGCPLSAADQTELELIVRQLTTTVQRAAWRETLSIGDTCACIDVNRVWYEARVVGVRGGGIPEQYVGSATPGRYLVPHSIDTLAKRRHSSRQILIHFAGWHRQWDEWVSCFSDRIQPAGTQCLKQSHSTTRQQVPSGSTPGVNRGIRGQFAARRLGEVLHRQRSARLPVFEPEGLALEAQLLAEQQWRECRQHLCVHAQVEAMVGVLVRSVEQNHREEERLLTAHAERVAAQDLQVQRANETRRRQTERNERQRLKLMAAQKRQDQKVSRAVTSVLKRLIGRVAAQVRNEAITAQRLARVQEQANKRLVNAARRQGHHQRQQEAASARAVRGALFDVVAEIERRTRQEAQVLRRHAHQQRQQEAESARAVRGVLSDIVADVDKRARQEAQVFGVVQRILQQVEKNLVQRPTLAFALCSGRLHIGQWLDVLWEEEPEAAAPQTQPLAAATSAQPQWYTAKILDLPQLPELKSSEWHTPLTLSYPVNDTEYEEEILSSWEQIKHIECRPSARSESCGRNNFFVDAKMQGKKRKNLEEDKGQHNSKRTRPAVQPMVNLAARETVTMTAAAHSSLLEELHVMQSRYGMMQAELQVRLEQ